MKDSEVYLRAAKSVFLGEYEFSCHAVNKAAKRPLWKEGGIKGRYLREFWDTNDDCLPIAMLTSAAAGGQCPKELRVLALCFMAAIAKSEGR